MRIKTTILTLTFGVFCAACLPAAAQDLTNIAGEVGSTEFVDGLMRRVDDLTERLVQGADGRVHSMTVVGHHSNIALGRGAIACSSIGGVHRKPICVTGRDTQPTERTDK